MALVSQNDCCSALSKVLRLNKHGLLHVVQLHHAHLRALHERCAGTKCSSAFLDVNDLVQGALRKLVLQAGPQHSRLFMTKLPDGHVLTIPYAAGEHQVVAAIKSAPMYTQPEPGVQASDAEEPALLYAIVQKPGTTIRPFLLKDHDKLTEADHFSRMSTIDHLMAQVRAAIPLAEEPRPIFSAPALGVLLGRLLRGISANTVKSGFCILAKNQGQGVYSKPLQLHASMSSLLLLKNAAGNIACVRCANGMIGYRTRADGGRTFIFVANSEDFAAEQPSEDLGSSVLQLFKMDYADTTSAGLRISVMAHHSQCLEHGMVSENMTVQQILNVIEKFFRVHNLKSIGCEMFPHYCSLMDQQADEDDEDDDEDGEGEEEEEEEEDEQAALPQYYADPYYGGACYDQDAGKGRAGVASLRAAMLASMRA